MANNEKLQLALEKDLETVRTSVDEVKKTADAALPSADLTQRKILELIGNLPIANGGTGSSTLNNFMNYKNVIEDADFNTCLTTGIYYIHSETPTFSNYPSELTPSTVNHSILNVQNIEEGTKANSILQILITTNYQAYSKYAKKIFYRLKFGSNDFTDWFKIFSSNEIVPIANGGTGANNSVDALNNLGAIPKSRISVPNFGQYNGSIPVHHMNWWTAVDESFSDVNNIKCSGLMQTIDGWSHLPNSEIAGIDGWGTLIVFAPEDTDKGYQANTNVLQIWYGMNSGGRLFIRKYRTSDIGWTRWYEMFTSNNVIPVVNGGTGATTAANALKKLGITSGTTDLMPGTSKLATGAIYLVYE